MKVKKSKNAIWYAAIFVDCPHCEQQQDLLEPYDEPRIPHDLELAENKTERTRNIEVQCLNCDESFIIPDLEW